MSFGLPEFTAFNRRVPKQTLYENLSVPAALKRSVIAEIKTIWWRNKLATTTVNLAQGSAVSEIEVFEIELATGELNEEVLRLMDCRIPYHLLFVLTFENRAQARIGYKEAAASDNRAFKVRRYYHTKWMPKDEMYLRIEGLNMDAVYENLVRQIAGERLHPVSGESLKESVERDEKRTQLEKQIAALEARKWREKQLNRRMEINSELKRLESELKKN